MKKYTHIYTLLLMVIFCTSGQGQNKTELPAGNTRQESKEVNTSFGPNVLTRNMIQDRKGNIWMASWDGIFRYDGKSFTNITNKVSSARFFSALEDRNGNMWFGSIGSGVYYDDGKSFRNFTTKEGLAGSDVTCIYQDKTGNIWFGTVGGASRYDGKSFRNFKMTDAPPPTVADSLHGSVYQHALPEVHWMHNDINAIIEDNTGKFWFGTRGYARIYDGKTYTVLTHDGKPFTNVRSIIEDKKGNIWLGGNDGLWRYDGHKFTDFTKKFVGYIMEDKKGNIWTSSERANSQPGALSFFDPQSLSYKAWALFRYDGKTLSDKKPTVTEIINKSMIFGILEDDKGNIWLGTVDGVCRYDGKTVTDFKEKIVQQ